MHILDNNQFKKKRYIDESTERIRIRVQNKGRMQNEQ